MEEGRTRQPATNRARDWLDAARASLGDVAAFSRLVEAHSGLVRSAAVRLLGAEDAQDASQEVWIRAWRNKQWHWFRVEDGKLAEHWAVRDDLDMLQQLGVMPPTLPKEKSRELRYETV